MWHHLTIPWRFFLFHYGKEAMSPKPRVQIAMQMLRNRSKFGTHAHRIPLSLPSPWCCQDCTFICWPGLHSGVHSYPVYQPTFPFANQLAFQPGLQQELGMCFPVINMLSIYWVSHQLKAPRDLPHPDQASLGSWALPLVPSVYWANPPTPGFSATPSTLSSEHLPLLFPPPGMLPRRSLLGCSPPSPRARLKRLILVKLFLSASSETTTCEGVTGPWVLL